MTRLLLVRHGLPELDPARPAPDWMLSDEGRSRCAPLAAAVARHAPEHVYSSPEPKALETARLVAPSGIGVTVREDLREHDGRAVPWLERDELERMIGETFARPNELVLGGETAAEALARFAGAVGDVERAHADRTVAVVSHGTVISLFVAARTGVDGYAFWRALGMPALVVLDGKTARIEDAG